MTHELVRAGTDLTIHNTVEYIGSVLLSELLGDAQLGKEAIFHLADLFLKNQDDATIKRNGSEPQVLDDVVEYLLMVGNSAHRASAYDITEYIKLKREVVGKSGFNPDNPNQKIKELLSASVLGQNLENTESNKHEIRLNAIIEDLSQRYKAIISGAQIPRPAQGESEKTYVPPQVIAASKLLLTNFPLLQRVHIGNYQDIAATIELETILTQLDKPYRMQIRSFVEDSIKREAENPNGENKKVSAYELLLQARVAYLVERGITPMCYRISTKHVTEEDVQTSMISAVSRLRSIEYTLESDIKKSESIDAAMYYMNFNSKMAYQIHNRRSRRSNRESHFANHKEGKSTIKNLVGIWGEDLTHEERVTYERIVSTLVEKKIDSTEWAEFFSTNPELVPDRLGILIGAIAGEFQTRERWYRAEEISYRLQTFPGGVYRNEYDEDDFYSPPPAAVVLGDDKTRVPMALVTAYVNNSLLTQIEDKGSVSLKNTVRWRNPLELDVEYSPQDVAIADILLENYTIFSKIPILSPRDILDGIILETLQKMTGNYAIDPNQTMGQNLIIRHMQAINRYAK